VLFRSDGGSGGGMSWARHWISEFLYTRRCTYPQSIYFYFFFSYFLKKGMRKQRGNRFYFMWHSLTALTWPRGGNWMREQHKLTIPPLSCWSLPA
jgi:hypothetical protein